MSHLPRIAIVGRTNVGKSCLFNRLTESRRAIVTPIAGTTRDQNETAVRWRGRWFCLADTGGWTTSPDQRINKDIAQQTEAAIRASDCVLFVVDGRVDPTAEDRGFARWLRRARIPVLLVINKIDNPTYARAVSPETYTLGFGDPLLVSAMNGRGTGDLLDALLYRLPKTTAAPPADSLRLAFVGRPNVGKSSLINSLLGDQRVLVSPEPFTTRDALEIPFRWQNKDFTLIDTAGLRRRVRIPRFSIEQAGAQMTAAVTKSADVAVLVLDTSVPLTAQDRTIVSGLLAEPSCLIVAANKWDLVPDKQPNTIDRYREIIAAQLPFIRWAPVVFVSARENIRVTEILQTALTIRANADRKIADQDLASLLGAILRRHPPTRGQGVRYPKIHELKQAGQRPPYFQITIGPKENLHPSYLPFVERMIRERYDFRGTPIRISIKKLLRRS